MIEKYLETRDPKIKNKLICENENLIHAVLKRGYSLQFHGPLHDQLIQEGRLALNKAIESYDPNRGKFSTLATTAIQNRFNDFFFERKKKLNLEYNEYVYFNYSAPKPKNYEDVYAAIDKLTEKEKELIFSYYPINGNKDKRSHKRFEHYQKDKIIAKLGQIYKNQ